MLKKKGWFICTGAAIIRISSDLCCSALHSTYSPQSSGQAVLKAGSFVSTLLL